MSHSDELKHRVFTQKSEADKAIHSLKGILLGINLDEEVNQKEIDELKSWVKTHFALIDRNPFKEFMGIIHETVSGNLPQKESIEDLFWLSQKYESDNYYYNSITTDLQTLQGICHGILSDGKINDNEVHGLNDWLKSNEHLSTYYPYDELRSLILSIVSDRKIDDLERKTLMAYLNQFVDLKNSVVSNQIEQETLDVRISGLCTSDPNISFEDKSFCITGILKRGSRNETLEKIKKLGGNPIENVTKNTHYLIVGDNGNPAWAFSCYGRKVEKAINLRKEGHSIMLIHEFDFFDILDDL